MLRAKLSNGIQILGLDAENIRRLTAGSPILADLKKQGGTDTVVIMYGDTVGDVLAALKKGAGETPPLQAMDEPDHPTAADYRQIPETLLEGLQRYAKDHIRTGGFLMSVLENDLTGAVVRADPHSMRALREIVDYVRFELPPGSHGSPEAVAEWIKARPH